MKIAFWSNVHGQTATTTNALAISSMMALTQQLTILLTHNHYHYSPLEGTLLGDDYKNELFCEFNDMGIDAISRFIKFNKVDETCVKNYATTIINKRLDFLTGTTQLNESLYYKDINYVIDLIFDAAKANYDLLMVDVASGGNELSNKILTSADLVVVNLNQNKYVLEDYFNHSGHRFKKTIFLISLYDKRSSYNLKNLQRKYPELKGNVAAIPYSRSYGDAINKGDVIDFLMRNLHCKSNDSNFEFVNGLTKAVELLLKKVEELDVEEENVS